MTLSCLVLDLTFYVACVVSVFCCYEAVTILREFFLFILSVIVGVFIVCIKYIVLSVD